MVENYDVAIIGGGPAGSTAATLLSKAGRRVIVLEQEKLHANFVEKFGGEIAEAGGEKAAKFYFKDGFASRTDRSYQVTRAKFDKMLLDHAGESGAEICEETSVDDVNFDGDGATIFLRASENIRAKYLIDASGRNSVIANKFKLKKSYQ